MSSRYIGIVQQSMLVTFEFINRKLGVKPKTKWRQLHRWWHHYRRINTKIVHLCNTIAVYGRFFSTLLSIFLPYNISVQCYLSHCILTQHHLPAYVMVFFCLSVVEFNVMLFTIIHECARVAKYCTRLERQNREFQLHFRKCSGFKYLNSAKMLEVIFSQSIQVHLNQILSPFLCRLKLGPPVDDFTCTHSDYSITIV